MFHKWPRICSTCRKHFLVFSSFMAYHGFVTRLTRPVSLMEQELLTFPGHVSSPPVFGGVLDTQFLALCVCFVDRCLFLRLFSFGHCVVCSTSIYEFWIPLLYLQTVLSVKLYPKITSEHLDKSPHFAMFLSVRYLLNYLCQVRNLRGDPLIITNVTSK